jgi:hypothetical protein
MRSLMTRRDLVNVHSAAAHYDSLSARGDDRDCSQAFCKRSAFAGMHFERLNCELLGSCVVYFTTGMLE